MVASLRNLSLFKGSKRKLANLQVLATEQAQSQQQQEREKFVEDSVNGVTEMQEAAAQNGAEQ